MRKFSCPPNVELLGQNITAFVDNLQAGEMLPIMQKHGIVGLDPEKWYPASMWMDALNELVQHPNVVSNLVAIGMEVGRIVPVPPHLTNPTLPDILEAWNGMYQYIHRNGDVGQIVCTKLSDKHYTLTFTDLYPDDMSYGILYAYGRRFLPDDVGFSVYYDPDLPQRDEDGGDKTVLHIEWR